MEKISTNTRTSIKRPTVNNLQDKSKSLQRTTVNFHRERRPQQVEWSQQHDSNWTSSDSILITGGIGDFWAIESFFSQEQRERLKVVFYATRQEEIIKKCFALLRNFPNLKQHTTVWNDWSKMFCFLRKDDCDARLGRKIIPGWKECRDWSIMKIFPRAIKEIPYTGSSFISASCGEIVHELPEKYMVICPCSVNDKKSGRDFSSGDWTSTLAELDRRGMKGVIVNSGNDQMPEDGRLINLSNQTDIGESIEILKKASCYWGIDSCMSILAAKRFDSQDLRIKSKNQHLYNFKHVYYAPKTEFSFVVRNI